MAEMSHDPPAALFIQGRIRGVERPALGSVLPTADGLAYFLDVGANVDSKPDYLFQFAQMGAAYAERMLGRQHPRVALLSNGEEPGESRRAFDPHASFLQQRFPIIEKR